MPDFSTIPNEVPKQPSSPVVIKNSRINNVIRAVEINSLPKLRTQKNPYEGKIQEFTKPRRVITDLLIFHL